MPPSRPRRALLHVLSIGLVLAAAGCYYSDAVRAELCLDGGLGIDLVDPRLNYFRNDAVGLRGYYQQDDTEGCPSLDNLTWNVSGSALQLNSTSGVNVTGTALQPGTSQVTASVGDFSASLDFDVAARGLTFGFSGLPAGGLSGSGILTSPTGQAYDIDGTTSLVDIEAGTWEYELFDVTDFHTYRGDPATGAFEVGRDLNLQVSASYTQYTGKLNFRALGVVDGVTGSFGSFTFGDQTVELTQSYQEFAVPPGAFSGAYVPLDPDGFNYSPSIAEATGTIASGEEKDIEVEYEATRGRLDLSALGLPEGATGTVRITGQGVDQTVDLNGSVHLEDGDYVVEPDVVEGAVNPAEQRTEDYAPVTPSLPIQIVAGQLFPLAVSFHLTRYVVAYALAWSILLDPWGHHPFLSTFRVGTFFLAVLAAASTGSDLPAQSGPQPIEITGPPGWIPLEGTVDAEGNVTASGSGTAAGFPDVPVTLTGTLEGDGSLDAEVTVGSETPPTGLPNGPIIYSITGSRQAPQIAPAGAP